MINSSADVGRTGHRPTGTFSFATLARCGHALFLDVPEEIIDILLSFGLVCAEALALFD